MRARQIKWRLAVWVCAAALMAGTAHAQSSDCTSLACLLQSKFDVEAITPLAGSPPALTGSRSAATSKAPGQEWSQLVGALVDARGRGADRVWSRDALAHACRDPEAATLKGEAGPSHELTVGPRFARALLDQLADFTDPRDPMLLDSLKDAVTDVRINVFEVEDITPVPTIVQQRAVRAIASCGGRAGGAAALIITGVTRARVQIILSTKGVTPASAIARNTASGLWLATAQGNQLHLTTAQPILIGINTVTQSRLLR
jgi:hypothetical protein